MFKASIISVVVLPLTVTVSMKTGEPMASVSADDPGGFALGLGEKISGPSARNGSTRARVSAIARSTSGLPTRI